MNRPVIGIALGDPAGVGPEVVLKALAREPSADPFRYLLIGGESLCRFWNEKLQLGLTIAAYRGLETPGWIRCLDPSPGDQFAAPRPGDPQAAQAALAWLTEGARRCLAGELAALVTAPVNKEAIINAGHARFTGQTEWLSEMAQAQRTAMMLLGHDDRDRWLRVTLATTHLPLRAVPDQLTPAKVELAIALAADACRWLGLPRARVGVCGLNPHAGEGGKMGTEEIDTVAPAVRAACAQGIDAVGPLAADTLFHQAFRGDFDVVVAMYHDQGLAPLKMVAFDHGINWTLGLPFIRTSPDHGTAYNIAGKGLASPTSMTAAIGLAKQLLAARSARRD